MLFARISEDGSVLKWPVKESTVRQVLANVALPSILTNESLAGTGFVLVPPILIKDLPQETKDKKLQLSRDLVQVDGVWQRSYVLTEVPGYIFQKRLDRKWREVRAKRDQLMNDFDWRIQRHQREVRLGLTPTDDPASLDAYMVALADITKADDPFLIEWPTVPAAGAQA